MFIYFEVIDFSHSTFSGGVFRYMNCEASIRISRSRIIMIFIFIFVRVWWVFGKAWIWVLGF